MSIVAIPVTASSIAPTRLLRIVAAVATAGMLGACGLKGPLYLPPPVGTVAPAPDIAHSPPPPQRPASSTSSASEQNQPTSVTPIP